MLHGEVMTDNNKQRVLSREVRERLEQLERQFPYPPTERCMPERRKLEWREEEEEPEQHLHYRETDSMAARRRQAEHDAWNNWFDSRFDERLLDEDGFLVEVVGTALGEAMADLRDEMDQRREEARETLSDEVCKLRTELCELSTIVTELRQALAAEHAKVLDLPLLPLARRAN
jgi:hypothetical protein